ncbi:hypothetical protein A9Q79_00840 [Methylophaga sp. 42_25_T18]|nr:hypothetical protein A9Q79_00840 [Methylophaga sp. 42_25_T18]
MTTLVIGGGWSGLAAAVTLCQQGKSVHVLESAKQLGGRARNVQWQDKTIDNGQHLMIGAYTEMLNIMSIIGVDPKLAFDRQTVELSIIDDVYPTLKLSGNNWLPWPLSLAWSLIRSAGLKGLLHVHQLQRDINTCLSRDDISVSEWLLNNNQSDRLIKQLWEPLCLATLNTPIHEASAHVLAKVIQDSLGQGKDAADLLIPKQPLGDVLPQLAADYINNNGGKISLQTRVTDIVVEQNKVSGVKTHDDELIAANNIIVATGPQHANQLLAPYTAIETPEFYPIATVYLQYPDNCRLAKAMLGMSGSISQWIFDRSQQHPGLMAVVISGPGKHEQMTNNELAERVSEEVNRYCPELPADAIDSLVIREKRATFACTVGIEQRRSKSDTNVEGLWLAGDYVANSYPATLEGAIRNGKNCALIVVNS